LTFPTADVAPFSLSLRLSATATAAEGRKAGDVGEVSDVASVERTSPFPRAVAVSIPGGRVLPLVVVVDVVVVVLISLPPADPERRQIHAFLSPRALSDNCGRESNNERTPGEEGERASARLASKERSNMTFGRGVNVG